MTKLWQGVEVRAHYPTLYTVPQSDGNSFCEYVVLDSVNMAYKDEDRILYQMPDYSIVRKCMKKKYFQISIMKNFNNKSEWRNYIFKEIITLKKF